MDAVLQVDHHPIGSSFAQASAENASGVVVRALLTVSGLAPVSNRAPIGLSFVIDRSGSMAGDRIKAARVAAARTAERLHPDDVVSVVAFDDIVETIAAPDRRARHHALSAALHALDVRGRTNLSGGWLRGREHMQAALAMIGTLPGSSRRIVLLTDGCATAGITDPSILVELTRAARHMGISTTTVGIGERYDDHLLRMMADAGGGNAWYIEHADQSQDVLAEELGNLLSICAQGLTATITLSDAVQILAVHSGWPTSQPTPGAFAFDLGDLYAAEPKPLLLELSIPQEQLDARKAAGSPIAVLTLTADVITPTGSVEHRTLHLPIASSLEGQQSMRPDVEQAVLLARAARAREDAARLQREGRAHEAQQVMREQRRTLAESPNFTADEYAAVLQSIAEDFDDLSEKYRDGTFSELDAKYQMQRSYNTRRGKASYDEKLRRRRGE